MTGKIKETILKAKSKPSQKPAVKDVPLKRMRKGDAYLCEICALSVHVDLCGEFLESQGLICCGQPMKARTKTTKA